jgi:hypothetical protein
MALDCPPHCPEGEPSNRKATAEDYQKLAEDKPLETPLIDPVAVASGAAVGGVARGAAAGLAVRATTAISGAAASMERAAASAQLRIMNSRAGSYLTGFTQGLAKQQIPGGSHLPLVPLNSDMKRGIDHGDKVGKAIKILKELGGT